MSNSQIFEHYSPKNTKDVSKWWNFLFLQACPRLIDRFREREENVKVNVGQLFTFVHERMWVTPHPWIIPHHFVEIQLIPLLQIDVFNTFIELLRQTANVTKGQMDIDDSRQVIIALWFVNNTHYFYIWGIYLQCMSWLVRLGCLYFLGVDWTAKIYFM